MTLIDNENVDSFANKMKQKLEKKSKDGYGGWENVVSTPLSFLSASLFQHALKGDPIDVANFAMMIEQRGEKITIDNVEVAEVSYDGTYDSVACFKTYSEAEIFINNNKSTSYVWRFKP